MTTQITTAGRRLRGRRNLLVVVAVLALAGIAAGGFGLWYILIGTPSPAAAVPVIPAGASVPAPASLDGSWQVNTSLGSMNDFSSSWVGYRVQEQLAGVGGHTAVGRTPKVTGSLTLAGSTVSAVSITADLTVLASDSAQRDDQLRRQAIETDKFPTATFKLTSPIALGSLPADGATVGATATGDLTIHGVDQERPDLDPGATARRHHRRGRLDPDRLRRLRLSRGPVPSRSFLSTTTGSWNCTCCSLTADEAFGDGLGQGAT